MNSKWNLLLSWNLKINAGTFPSKTKGRTQHIFNKAQRSSKLSRERKGIFCSAPQWEHEYSLVNFLFIDVKMKQDPGYQGWG